MLELECQRVSFYAPLDETAFFTRVEAIPAVTRVEGRGDAIILSVKSKRISDASLRELPGWFCRYRISMRLLAPFRTSRNAGWFADPGKYWFRRVFGARLAKDSSLKSTAAA